MKDMLLWWLNPKQTYSIIKIPLGLVFTVLLIVSAIYNFEDFIKAFKTEPLFTGMFLLFLPLALIVFFSDTILSVGLLYTPYSCLGEKQGGWKSLFKTLCIYLIAFIVLRLIRSIVFAEGIL